MASNKQGLFCSFEDLVLTPGNQFKDDKCYGKVCQLIKCRDPGTAVLRLYYRELSKRSNAATLAGGESQPSVVLYEFQLIMARAGLFYEGTDGLNICQNHRKKLGWKWERPDRKCYHPDHVTWCEEDDPTQKLRTHGCNVITLDQSKKMFRDYGTLLPIGTGICEVCSTREKSIYRMPADEIGEAFSEDCLYGNRLKNEPLEKDLGEGLYPVSLLKVNEFGTSIEAEQNLEGLTVTNSSNGVSIKEEIGENLIKEEIGENSSRSVIVQRVNYDDLKEPATEVQVKSEVKDPNVEVEASLCNIVFHVCTSCLQGFETEEELADHRESVHGEKVKEEEVKMHTCEICSEKFDDYVDLCSHHFLKHHLDSVQDDQTVQVVGVRGKRRNSNENLMSAKRPNVISQAGSVDCVLTDSEMETMFEFILPSVQLKVNFSAWDHVCRFCHMTFLEYEPYRLHLRQHRMDNNIACPICGEEFQSMKPLYDHMKAHEQENSINARESQPKFCDHCSYIFPDTFIKTRGCLVEGKEYSNIEMCYMCVFCMAACSCSMEFPADGHLPVPFRCIYHKCFAVFQLESDMARHSYYNHDGCHICEYRISKNDNSRIEVYEDHLRVNHKCPKCGKTFKEQKQKTRHILEEHKQVKGNKKQKGRPSNRKCYSCGAAFLSIEDKQKHVQSFCPVLKKKNDNLKDQFEGLLRDDGTDSLPVPMTIMLKNKGGMMVLPKKCLYDKFVCLFCMNILKSQLDFNVHPVTCKPILKCTACEENLRESEGFDFHSQSCKSCRTLSCVICRKFTAEPEAAFNHARMCKKTVSFMIACCILCKQKVSTYEAAALHRCSRGLAKQSKTKFEEEQEEIENEMKRKEEARKLAAIPVKKRLKSGVVAVYRCQYCNINLPTKSSSHELYCSYNNKKSRRQIYGCDYCNIKYDTRAERDVHLIGCQRGKCDHCHENFGNEGHRIMHMRGCRYKASAMFTSS